MGDGQKKPWANEDGSFKSTSEIKSLCQSWSIDVWEEYLKTIEISQKESPLATGESIEDLSENQYASLFVKLIGQKEYPHLARVTRAAIEALSVEQKKIILALYWENKSIAEISRHLGKARATIRVHRDRGLKFLSSLLLSGTVEKALKASQILHGSYSNKSPFLPPHRSSEETKPPAI